MKKGNIEMLAWQHFRRKSLSNLVESALNPWNTDRKAPVLEEKMEKTGLFCSPARGDGAFGNKGRVQDPKKGKIESGKKKKSRAACGFRRAKDKAATKKPDSLRSLAFPYILLLLN
ncbi:hypothetical protein LI177_14195 [bacterium 210820-DFI.6.37]|nr:hypothetical protein [bacterium 210820-DFI.6.37]